jgi:hypothetical protein
MMASPYTTGTLEARDIAEQTGVNETDVNTAATLAGLIADDTGEMLAGTATKVADSTTIVVAHSFAAAPDFILSSGILKDAANKLSVVSNTTSVTWTRLTTTTSWSISYIIGYTA